MLDQEQRWKIRNKMNPDNIFDPPGIPPRAGSLPTRS